MDDERDLVVFSDDEGNEITMEVMDYFFYDGKEYAVISEAQEDCEGCEKSCEECENQREVFVMEVRPVGDDEEEFVPVEDPELEERLMELVEGGLYDSEEEEDWEEDDLPEE